MNFKKLCFNRRRALQNNQDWKNIDVLTKKVNRLLNYIPTDNITELNEIIYAGAKLVYEKIGIS